MILQCIWDMWFEEFGRKKLGDTYSKDKIYQKLHKHQNNHEKTGQFIDKHSTEFWYMDLKKKEEEHSHTSAPMPIDAEMMLDVERGMTKGHAYGFGIVELARMRVDA